MSDSTEFSSLYALVDSHLSKTDIQKNKSGGGAKTPFKIPSLRDGPNESSSEGRLFSPLGQRLSIPTLSVHESPITNILTEQIANMLKAKEKKQQQEEEKKRIEEEMQKLKIDVVDDKYVIDLVEAIQTPYEPALPMKEEVLSSSSSFESLFEPKFTDKSGKPFVTKTPKPSLPCLTDMSYILDQKVRMAKPSSFGKVLSSRLKPVAAPYLHVKVENNIKRFDFSIPSPCDRFREKLKKPTMSYNFTPNTLF